ncbi:MAG: cytochrome C [Xanthobacteraceae bacterium]
MAALAALGTIFIASLTVVGFTRPAQALPSFARQTGQPCGTCHTDFPGLTPFGRRFKLMGYTVGGGPYRTTPFPVSEDDKSKPYVPPISMMAVAGFTNTQAPLAPPTDPYKPNNNVVVAPVSFFWGGAITENVGAFAQVTYVPPPAGGFGDPFGHTWTWDNTDVRFAGTTKIFGLDVLYGITANNNPTVQDVWNTTPAWTFPYAASTLAGTPGAKTIIDGTFAAHVGSVGGYAWINDMVYLEATAYRTLDFGAQNALGTDPLGAPGMFAVAPYWRVAIEPHFGNQWLMVGAFGMIADIHPFDGTNTSSTFPQTDNYTDVGVDSQYQYQGDNYWITLRGSWIHEFQRLDASFANGLAANPTNELNTLRLQASVAYGSDNRIVLTGQYFDTWGTSDPTLYAGFASGNSPDSNGFTAEIAYIPFSASTAPGWPWFNARIALQYVWYDKFDGTTVGASGNNTLFLHAWIAM